MHPAAVVALVASLLLAGCSGLGPVNPDPTVTPAPVPADDPAVPGFEGTLPAGVEPSGVTDTRALGRAHAEELSGRSYTLELVEARARDSHALPVVRHEESVRVRRPGLYRHDSVVRRAWLGHGLDREERTAVYADGTTRYVRTVENGTARYERGTVARWRNWSGTHAQQAGRAVGRYLDVTNATLSTVDRDGKRLLRVRGRGSRTVEGERYRVEAHLDGAFVVWLEARWVEPREDEDVFVRVTMTYDRVDATTVAPPGWYGEALRATEGGGDEANASS
ncbi:hypothetical protein [Halomarina litorea]|uniref:hypothetical protein n=1 Tax=Halomarina litorea TaxID=2961595 RepID=UPI0020C2E2AF|nr:hypothetical protein [Halomarina sp. BCD28]